MAKYNSGFKYNLSAEDGGAKYNSARFFILVNLFEVTAADDRLGTLFAKNILLEKANIFQDFLAYAEKKFREGFQIEDSKSVEAFCTVKEDANIQAMFNEIVVRLYLKEGYKAVDAFMRAITFIENINAQEKVDVKAAQELIESLGIKEIEKALVDFLYHEYVGTNDHTPRKAINDFLIGYIDNMDRSFEYFLPLEMVYDPNESDIQVMPQAESTYIELPFRDGSIVENTVYKNRFFNIVAWSQDGLNISEKEQLKADIARLLDATKEKPRKLTFQKSNVSFDVKYSGAADIKEGPSFVKASIPFEAPPYGYPMFSQQVHGSGLLMNRGDAVAYPENIITGKCVNPSFQIGNVYYLWEGTVPERSKLVINHENMTCYLEDSSGVRENAMAQLSGDFQSIKPGKSIQINAHGATSRFLTTNVVEKVLWRK